MLCKKKMKKKNYFYKQLHINLTNVVLSKNSNTQKSILYD